MRSLRFVLAFVVCVSGSRIASAQTPSGDGWVVLPVDEYRALRHRAAGPAPPTPTESPVEATVTRIEYDLRAETDTAIGRAVLAIDVLRLGWVKVPVPAGVHVRNALLDGQPLRLVNGPARHVLLSRPGRSLVTLDVVLPMKASAGIDAITIPASAAPMTVARLRIPRDGVELSAGGGFVAERAEAAGETRWTAIGQPNQALVLAWKRKVDDRRAEQPLRTRARLTSVVGLGEETAQITTAVRVEVLQGLARETMLTLPAGVVVNQVNGATVADWDVSGSALRVRFLDPVTADVTFTVLAESRVTRDGSIDIPILRVTSAERETGGVAVDVAGAGEIGERRARGLDGADPSELGDVVNGRESPSMVAFRLRPLGGHETRSLSLDVVRYTPQPVLVANVEEARYRALASDDGRLLVQARYALRNNQRSFLKVTLPPQSTLWSTSIAGRPIRPGLAERDAVLVPLEKGRAAEEAPRFVVELVYSQAIAPWSDRDRARIELPALDLPISRTGFELRYSPRFRVLAEPGVFRVDFDRRPFSEAMAAPAPPPASSPAPSRSAEANVQALIERFNNESRSRGAAGALPVNVTFPEFGPSIFLASELTAEGVVPFVDVTVRAERGTSGSGR